MESLKTHLIRFLAIYIPLAVIVICLFLFWIIGKYEESKIKNQVQSNGANASAAKATAINANASAITAEIGRKTEDAYRAKVITPQIEAARKRSQNSRISLENAKRKLENEKTNPQNLNASHAANCAKLRELFPDTQFADCR